MTDIDMQVPALTRQLSEFIECACWSDIPEPVRHEAKRALVNYFAVCMAGAGDPDIDKAAAVFERFSAANQASVIGRTLRTDMLNAASLNAMSANVYDYDDTHIPTIIHPSAPIAATLFALAETQQITGEQLLLAFILGVEVACRLGVAISPGHYQRGWHITSTCGVFGAAAAAAKLLGLDSQRVGWALGNASAQSSGLVETLGSMSKSLGVGNAARNGLLSALLAKEGFSGPEQPIEGERGFLRVMGDNPDFTGVINSLGQRWELLANTYKPYPCGVVLNPVIEACIALYHDRDWSIDDLSRIEVTGHPLLRERTDRPDIRSGRESQVSAQHAVAVTLTTGKAGLPQFSDAAVSDLEVRSLYRKLVFLDDMDYSVQSAQIRIFLESGQTKVCRVEVAHGSLAAPLSDNELEIKLCELGEYGRSGCDTRMLIDALWSFEHALDAGALMKLTVRA
ncbi:2-methylcitrate dehydratase PrpD [Pseudomonas sp. NFACC23-1]|uniref:MmgE/PrpD family protein n=1 Tax=unclassified Pseudomonas TaxID=196821 RepID=UPI00088CAE9B|nr:MULTISPECIES: MmgE/PrpD family protein [unclassified Pseudomonas]SDB50691.1 2-methylcitrate dehydratase PrpD [Pseudomonas sp. NFACC17-2]SEI92376.1 2-methylcitrate dehydratase PrpD [Pseudomonas sp. NFACC23-1]SFW85056.1 2-methylcitrate dehydratase PrpD [Pseudomonas sp. NFACC16-2]